MLCFLWFKDYRNNKTISINFDNNNIYDVNEQEYPMIAVNIHPKNDPLPKKFFGNSIENFKIIIGKNGAGKTYILNKIIDRLKFGFYYSEYGFFAIYKFNNEYYIDNKKHNEIKLYDSKNNEINWNIKFVEITDIFCYWVFISNIFDGETFDGPSLKTTENKFLNYSLNDKIRKNHKKMKFENKTNFISNEAITEIYKNLFDNNYRQAIASINYKFPQKFNLEINHNTINEKLKIKNPIIFNQIEKITNEFKINNNCKKINGRNIDKIVIHVKNKNELKNIQNIFIKNAALEICKSLFIELDEKYFNDLVHLYSEILKENSNKKSISIIFTNYSNKIKNSVIEDAKNVINILINFLNNQLKSIEEYNDFIFKIYDLYLFDLDLFENETKKELIDFLNIIEKNNWFSITWLTNKNETLSTGNLLNLRIYNNLYDVYLKTINENNKNLIILIDEWDVYLHPNKKIYEISNLLTFINNIFVNYKIQIIITTNSPFSLSDIPHTNIKYLGENIEKIENEPTFGANIHTLLRNNFFMDSTIGEFSKRKINKAIEILNKPYKNSSEVINKEEKDYLKKIIPLLGDPIIKNKLQAMYDELYPNELEDSEIFNRIINGENFNLDNSQKKLFKSKLENALRKLEDYDD